MKKKLLTVVLLLLLATTLESCTASNRLINQNANDTGTDEDYLPDYVFYFESSGSSTANPADPSTEYLSKISEPKIFSFSSKTKTERPSDAADQITININGDSCLLDYGGTYETALSESTDFKYFSKFNLYKTDTIRAYTRGAANELLYFSNTGEVRSETNGGITESEAKKTADSTLLSLYGEKACQEYTFDEAVYTETELIVQYTVIYRKYVWGTPTNDAIQISINTAGKVVAVNAKSLGLFSSAENKLTKQNIDNAVNILRDTFSDKWTVGTAMLVLDSKGDYYVSAHLLQPGPEKTDTMVVYVNVK